MSYRGEIKGGVVVLDGNTKLPDGTLVMVQPLPLPGASEIAGDEDELSKMGDLAVETGIKDLARNCDHYLYGHPKVEDAT